MKKLVVGITGHRDIYEEDQFELYQVLKKLFKKLKTKYDLTVLNSLASGSDSLVAHVILDMKIKYQAILPLDLDIYQLDFDHIDRIDLYDFVNHAETAKVISKEGDHNVYYHASKYIVDNCDILIALWNGEKQELEGGTYHTINQVLEQNKKVFHIITRRKSSSFLSGNNFEVREIKK